MNKTYIANENHPELKVGVEVFYSGEFSDCWITRNFFKIPGDYEPPNKPDWYDEVKWKPENGDDYFYVTEYENNNQFLIIQKTWWEDTRWDKYKYSIGNCYKTREEAEQARERVLKAYKGE